MNTKRSLHASSNEVSSALADPQVRDNLLTATVNILLKRGTLPAQAHNRAEEIVQEVVLRALTKQHTYNPAQGTVEQWCRGFIRFAIVDEYRSRQRRRCVSLDLTEMDTKGTANPDPVADQDEVNHLLNGLDAQDAQLLRLRYHHHMDNAEVADYFQITKENAATQMCRAHAHARAHFC
jgi:RNA polymerase sigma factor (sigma-70 family)